MEISAGTPVVELSGIFARFVNTAGVLSRSQLRLGSANRVARTGVGAEMMKVGKGYGSQIAIRAALVVVLAYCLAPVGLLGEESDESDPVRSRLLGETPNYIEVLRDQWSEERAEDLYGRYFGLLSEASDEQSVSLEQCIALALQNNTGLKIGRLNPVLATNEVRRAYSVFDPAIFAGASKFRETDPLTNDNLLLPEGVDDTFNGRVAWNVGLKKGLISGGAVALEWTNDKTTSVPSPISVLVPQYRSELNLSLNQPLLRNFGWRYALLNVDVAESVEEAAFFQYRAQVADLVLATERSYWTLVLATANVDVEEQGLELARELLRQNKGRFDVGALPRTAVLESEAEVARREANLVRANNLQRIARDVLSVLVNSKSPDTKTVLLLTPTDKPTLTEYEIDTRRSFDRAIATRPELIAARLDLDSKRLLQRAAENQLLPRLDFVGSIGLSGLGGRQALDKAFGQPVNVFPRVNNGYSSALNLLTDGRFYQYNVGVVFEVPINNAAAKAAHSQSKVDRERSELSLQQLEENVTLEIKNAIDNVRSQLKSIEATRVASRLAEENVRNQKARYDVGLATNKDLIDFQQRLTRARQAEIQSLTQYNTRLAELRRADGTLLEQRNIVMRKADPEDAPWWGRF